jgi:hypothetical protein
MFFRTKTSGPRSYLQVVETRWEDGRSRQRVIATLGRLDHLQQSGQLDALLASGARLSQSVLLRSAHAQGQVPTITTQRIVPALIFQRLWQQTGCRRVIERLLDGRLFECDVERAIFLTVLHRLFAPGSDRAADKWKADYQWTSPRMAGARITVYPARSYSAGDMYPSDECRRIRLKKTSMYSKMLARASALVAKNSPRVSSFFRLAKKLSIGALSQQLARRLMLQVIPWTARRPW